MLEERAGIGGY
ncbi:56f2747c-17c9-4e9a-9879-15a9952720e2 [Thermothielavioides terrestris]|uniref:56f2747c-17c9-4e9a-9879-15a9952720e2 n=1 Tax=Thermothielavioides terrestris TaxID=2587410 RepID=A0A3S4D3Q2_9PEZI|nr:56f2747c-17c9-4e9a-9879-15a9952720e2 [Thermothielavioides terrestris]